MKQKKKKLNRTLDPPTICAQRSEGSSRNAEAIFQRLDSSVGSDFILTDL